MGLGKVMQGVYLEVRVMSGNAGQDGVRSGMVWLDAAG